MSDFSLVRAVLLRPHQRFEAELAHQALNGLMIDRPAQLANGSSDSSIPIPPLVASVDDANLLLQVCILVARLGRLLLIVEGAACDARQLEQAFEGEVLP